MGDKRNELTLGFIRPLDGIVKLSIGNGNCGVIAQTVQECQISL
jgi:hypothetical protein